MINKNRSVLIFLFFFSFCQGFGNGYTTIKGKALGTSYTITYKSGESIQLRRQIDSVLNQVNASLSTYVPSSVISRINNNDTTAEIDNHFKTVFERAEIITGQTKGAFDMTVAPLVNAWGFGFTGNKRQKAAKSTIDSLMEFVGMEKIRIVENRVIKTNPGVMLDGSAIAKGYAVDAVSEFLESVGIEHYMVEIGGEVRTRGVNSKGKSWRIGIDKPVEGGHGLHAIVSLQDKSLATSGNYRQYFYIDDKKYAHIINPVTGYPAGNKLLSASIMAEDCMTADAFATACIVLGWRKSMRVLKSIPGVDGYFIIAGRKNTFKIKYTKGFDKLITQLK